MIGALRLHWPEYLMEAALLGSFMISASLFASLLEFPGSPVHQAIPHPTLRRALMGVAMGLTAIGLVYSPWGSRSGAHFNPALTLAFHRLGMVAPADAVWYTVAQFAGGVAGMLVALALLGVPLAHPAVHYVATWPRGGAVAAFGAETVISFGLMLAVLTVSNRREIARWTGVCAGLLVALYITLEAPISGMSMNPARTFASAFVGHTWAGWWIYFTAPPLGMLVATEVYRRWRGARALFCAKLYHPAGVRCIFCEHRLAASVPGEV